MPAQLVSIETAPDLVDQVYRALLGAISSGSLAPGERITQEDIAQRLSVSRQPVLQALRLLKKDGFVLDAPGRGVLVAPLDAEWMRKVYQVRGASSTKPSFLSSRSASRCRASRCCRRCAMSSCVMRSPGASEPLLMAPSRAR